MAGALNTHDSGALALTFDYDQTEVQAVKATFPGAKWSVQDRAWLLPESRRREAIAFCEQRDWSVGTLVRAALEAGDTEATAQLRVAQDRCAAAGIRLYDYQPPGVLALARNKRWILAWEMRTGKTIVTLGAIPPGGVPVLVVTPLSGVGGWIEDASRMLPDYKVYEADKPFVPPAQGELCIVRWSMLPKVAAVLHPDTVLVLDEAHKAKNPDAQRTQSARMLVQSADRVWGLTGTPVQNHPLELWNLLGTFGLERAVFGNWPTFLNCFGAHRDPNGGPLIWGPPAKDVPDRLRRAMSRLTFQEAARHLPPPVPRYIPVEVHVNSKTARAWNESLPRWEDALRRGTPPDPAYEVARKELATLKAKALKGVIEDIVDSGGGPVVVFSDHRAPILELEQEEGWGAIHGTVSSQTRIDLRRKFQAGALKGLACTIGAAQESLTLSKAKSLIFLDLNYNPSVNAQAMARADDTQAESRAGIFILAARGTIDERLLRILAGKTQMVRKSLGDKAVLGPRRPPPKRTLGDN